MTRRRKPIAEPCPAEQAMVTWHVPDGRETTYLPCNLARGHEGFHVCTLPDGAPYVFQAAWPFP